MTDTIVTPWTPEQIAGLERYQRSGWYHPYTCGNRDRKTHPVEAEYGDFGVLHPTVNGWVCPYCDYTQEWAHSASVNLVPEGKERISMLDHLQGMLAEQRQQEEAESEDPAPPKDSAWIHDPPPDDWDGSQPLT